MEAELACGEEDLAFYKDLAVLLIGACLVLGVAAFTIFCLM